MDFLSVLQLVAYLKLRRAAREFRAREARGFVNRSDTFTISPGTDMAGGYLAIPLPDWCAHGIIVGATGSGKSYAALSLMQQLLNIGAPEPAVSFGLLDAKGELWSQLHDHAHATDDIVSLDFGGTAPVPYALLRPRAGETAEELVERRMEIFEDMLGGDNQFSLRMSRMLRSFLLLALEHEMPFPLLETLFTRPDAVCQLAQRSQHPRVKTYFEFDFVRERQTTLPALTHRLDFLLRHEQLRLSFGADQFIDFRDAMDRGRVLLINCGGPRLPRTLAQIVQSLVLSDLRQATFSRTHSKRPYLWFVDEAQTLFARKPDTDNLTALLTMSRSFGVFVVFITQSLTAAVQADFRAQLETNVRWLIVFRSGLRDARILERALPATDLHDVTNLPPRTGYFWLRGAGRPPVLIKTHRVVAARDGQARIVPTTVPAAAIRERLAEAERRLFGSQSGSATTRSAFKRKGTVDEVLRRLEQAFVRGDADGEV